MFSSFKKKSQDKGQAEEQKEPKKFLVSPSFLAKDDLNSDDNRESTFVEGLQIDLESKFMRQPIGSVYNQIGHDSSESKQSELRMDRLLFNPKLSYHGDVNREFQII